VADRILLIEDDPRLAEMVKTYLDGAGFQVTVAADGAAGLALERRETFDAVVLDLTLPDIDGLDVCRQIRASAATPILMLTARGEPVDRVIGLELGADDYLGKPFEPRELTARLKAILRRIKGASRPDVLRFGRLDINYGAREVRLDGKVRPLTSTSILRFQSYQAAWSSL
jgi:DNA-binding response OmpR family regulator